jgi:hypothetical protein
MVKVICILSDFFAFKPKKYPVFKKFFGFKPKKYHTYKKFFGLNT